MDGKNIISCKPFKSILKKVELQSDIIIIGGGLAGLTCAIDMGLRGHEVLLIEKKEYPFHKVCGEYVSNEVKPYLQSLGAFPQKLGSKEINRFQITSPSGKIAECKMQMGGFGVSRYAFDQFLFERASELGVKFMLNTTAQDVSFDENQFSVKLKDGQSLKARVVIGAFGKRSVLDKNLDRKFFKHKTNYVGVKHHFRADFPDDLVALHNFEGGYCGLSKVENDKVNLCYLTTTEVFKKYKSIEEMEHRHLSQNPYLRDFLAKATSVFDPLVISQVNFADKESVVNHMLMCGDAAGLIHPLCGNGMAMAIHGAKISSGQVDLFLRQKLTRDEMEKRYKEEWSSTFHARLQFGHAAQGLFEKSKLTEVGVWSLRQFPGMLQRVVRLSHGKELH